jgi:hypothetical protein
MERFIFNLIIAYISLANALVKVVSFGFIDPQWVLTYHHYRAKKQFIKNNKNTVLRERKTEW